MIKNRTFALIFRGGSFFFILAGVLVSTGLFSGQADASIMFYTIQSNLLALLLFGLLLFRTIKGLKEDGISGPCGYFSRFEMVCVIDLLLTMLVFWALLAPSNFTMSDSDVGFSLWTFENLSVHLVTPLLCLIDYFLFAKPGSLKYRDVYGVLIFPFCYLLFVSIAGFSNLVSYPPMGPDGVASRFPYFFIDFDALGFQVFLYIAALSIFFLLLSHGLYWLDKKRTKAKPVLPSAA